MIRSDYSYWCVLDASYELKQLLQFIYKWTIVRKWSQTKVLQNVLKLLVAFCWRNADFVSNCFSSGWKNDILHHVVSWSLFELDSNVTQYVVFVKLLKAKSYGLKVVLKERYHNFLIWFIGNCWKFLQTSQNILTNIVNLVEAEHFVSLS